MIRRHAFLNLIRCLTVVLLLAAQGLALAHEVIHVDGNDLDLCPTCTLAKNLDPIAASALPTVLPQSTDSLYLEPLTVWRTGESISLNLARGPPSFS
jgi:hypothetical protein